MTDITIRPLRSKDLFPISAILRKIGIKELRTVLPSSSISSFAKGRSEARDAGISLLVDISGTVISNLPSAEKEIYAFLSSITDTSEEELRDMPLPDFLSLIHRLFSSEAVKDFFSRLVRSFR